jgi:hypothetical protein
MTYPLLYYEPILDVSSKYVSMSEPGYYSQNVFLDFPASYLGSDTCHIGVMVGAYNMPYT